jgi:hypothetical protein
MGKIRKTKPSRDLDGASSSKPTRSLRFAVEPCAHISKSHSPGSRFPHFLLQDHWDRLFEFTFIFYSPFPFPHLAIPAIPCRTTLQPRSLIGFRTHLYPTLISVTPPHGVTCRTQNASSETKLFLTMLSMIRYSRIEKREGGFSGDFRADSSQHRITVLITSLCKTLYSSIPQIFPSRRPSSKSTTTLFAHPRRTGGGRSARFRGRPVPGYPNIRQMLPFPDPFLPALRQKPPALPPQKNRTNIWNTTLAAT